METILVANARLSTEIMTAQQTSSYVEEEFLHKDRREDANVILGEGIVLSAETQARTSLAIGGVCQNANTLAVGFQDNGGILQHAQALGLNSTALGQTALAIGKSSVSLGTGEARGNYSVTAGGVAYGQCSMTQGHGRAYGEQSHAEGQFCESRGNYSHAEGGFTVASGSNSHSEGVRCIASGDSSHAEGHWTQAVGNWSHAEGGSTSAIGPWSHAEGGSSLAVGAYSFAAGQNTAAFGSDSIAVGSNAAARSKAQLSVVSLSVSPGTIVKWTSSGWVLASESETASEKCKSETSSTTYQPYTLNNWSNTEHEIVRGRPSLEEGKYYKLSSSIVSNVLYTMSVLSGGDAYYSDTFVWSGDKYGATGPSGKAYYNSHGNGTFNINPMNGAAGFYIGDTSLADCIRSIVRSELSRSQS